MKLSCQIVQDLMPLMHDGVCSEDSKNAVSEHLQQCEKCRKMSENIADFAEPKLANDVGADESVIRKGFRKIRRRWILSVLAIVMIFPVILLGVMIKNETKEEGVCFSNLDELNACESYLQALSDGEYAQAAQCIDFTDYFGEIREALALQPQDYTVVYEPIDIDGEDYMVNRSVLEQYLDEEDFWSAIFRACEAQAPIPEEIWTRFSDEPSVRNGVCYLPYETNWGTFMVTDTLFETLMAQREPALYDFFAIMPEAMYEAQVPEIEKTAQLYYEDTQHRLARFKAMDATAFEDFMRGYYAEKIENGVQIESYDYLDAFFANGLWNIRYAGQIAYAEETHRIAISFYAKDGNVVGLHMQNVEDEAVTRLLNSFTPRID